MPLLSLFDLPLIRASKDGARQIFRQARPGSRRFGVILVRLTMDGKASTRVLYGLLYPKLADTGHLQGTRDSPGQNPFANENRKSRMFVNPRARLHAVEPAQSDRQQREYFVDYPLPSPTIRRPVTRDSTGCCSMLG